MQLNSNFGSLSYWVGIEGCAWAEALRPIGRDSLGEALRHIDARWARRARPRDILKANWDQASVSPGRMWDSMEMTLIITIVPESYCQDTLTSSQEFTDDFFATKNEIRQQLRAGFEVISDRLMEAAAEHIALGRCDVTLRATLCGDTVGTAVATHRPDAP